MHVYICMYVCMYVCVYVCMYVGMYVRTYVGVCMYVCMYVRMYVFDTKFTNILMRVMTLHNKDRIFKLCSVQKSLRAI